MSWKPLCLAAIAALVCAPVAGRASEPEPAETSRDHEMPLGARTRVWLERQRSGIDASDEASGLTPPAERRARMRYLRSFEHPIPPLFDLEDTSGGGD